MTTNISHSMRARLLFATSASALLASLAIAPAATAQTQTVDARWQPFLGCWVPDESSAAVGQNAVSGSMVCVVPVQNSASVDIVSIVNRVVMNRDRITATGERTPKTADECQGWESAKWSVDGRRVFTRSEFGCGNNVTVKASGVFALSATGEWVQVQGTAVGLNSGARVVKFRPADVALAPGSIITDSSTVTTVPAQSGFAQQAMRTAAATTTDANMMLDMSRNVDEQVSQAWLSEFGITEKLNAKQLVALADAGMPSAISDMMIAMANPERFQIRTRSPETNGSAQITATDRAMAGRCDFSAMMDPRFDVSGMPLSAFDRRYCLSRYGGAFGYPFGYLSGWQYGWGNYPRFGYNGYNGSNYYYGNQPIIIVTRNPDGDIPLNRGRAVKGGGYSSGSSSGSSSSTPRQTVNPSSGSSGSSSSGSSTTTTGGGAASSGGDSGARTAKPRPPGGGN